MRIIGERMALGEIRCCCLPKYVAVERHHPTGAKWETGKGLKAHDWFIIPLSKQAHDEYHRLGAREWTRRYGTHETLLKAFWQSIGFVPGDYMTVGMNPKRAEWLRRVLGRL